MSKILKAASNLITAADKFNSEYPSASETVEELFMPGLSEYNKAFQKLRSEVEKAKKAMDSGMEKCFTEILRDVLKRDPVPEDAKRLTLAQHPQQGIVFDIVYSVYYGDNLIPLGLIKQSVSETKFIPNEPLLKPEFLIPKQ